MIDEPDNLDVIIIGGGPAGMSASLWCDELGLSGLLLEREAELGGQMLRTFNPIKNYLGAEAKDGVEMRDRFLGHIDARKCPRRLATEVINCDLARRTVHTVDRTLKAQKAIIIASGVRRRQLGIPGEKEFFGRGILVSGVKSAQAMEGKSVVIVGGGDAAIENAILLARTAKEVIVIHRRKHLTARPEFLRSATANPKIEFQLNSIVTSIWGQSAVESVGVQNADSDEVIRVETDFVLIRIGVMPNTDLFQGQVEMNGAGYVSVRGDCRTSLPGIYAIGDVAAATSPTISTAVGTGATAVKSVASKASESS